MSTQNRRCVIVGGAPIADYARIRARLREDDFAIYCDCGLNHREGLDLEPSLIIGDFDSHENPNLDTETIVLPCEKDDTDTFFAVKEAIRRGFDDFLLIGIIGQRIDHTLANLSILLMLDSQGKHALALDDHSELEILSRQPILIPDTFSFFSLLCIEGSVTGVTIENAKYPLDNATIECDYQYAVSNEVLPGKSARVSVSDGRLLLIKID